MTEKEPQAINYDLPEKTNLSEMESAINEIAGDVALYKEKNFDKRIEAIDLIEFQIIGHIESLLMKTGQPEKLFSVKNLAEKVRTQLEEMDNNVFQKLRANIREGRYMGAAFKNLVQEYVSFNLDDNENQEEPGYDNLDMFINGLFVAKRMPEQTKDLAPEMVYYQKTPARIVFELVEKGQFTKEDVFFDLGSGLGQAAILVNLLAGITVTGIEFEPAFCEYAKDCAALLNLSSVTFINADARNPDYSEGTVFFMYTPFRGEIMQDVLSVLRKASLMRKIKIITYGPCTIQVAAQNWLNAVTP